MSSSSVTRRRFLRGLGSIGVALPMLEILREKTRWPDGTSAYAATPPTRYVFAYVGTSIGSVDGDGFDGLFVPKKVGRGYDLPVALAPLGKRGVRDHVSVISGLKIPWDTGGGVPPGGRVAQFHSTSVPVQLTGNRVMSATAFPNGPSSDQIVAAKIGEGTRQKILAYRVEGDTYGFGMAGHLSFPGGGSGANEPFESPRLAYESLFTGFQPADPTEKLKAQRLLRRRTSVLDLVRDDTQKLLPQLGAWDRARLERHFDEIRALETRIAATPAGLSCTLPPKPGADPPLADPAYTTGTANFSHEDKRAELLVDLIHMAFACDLSRVASLQFNRWKSYLNMAPLTGAKSDIHELTHYALPFEALASAIAWHIDHFARLVEKLRDTPDAAGGTLLDRTALALTFEGGWGYDPEGDRTAFHSTENMSMLLAGHAGGLKPGQHVVATGKHPVNVVISAMNAVGVPGGLGEITGNIPELFV